MLKWKMLLINFNMNLLIHKLSLDELVELIIAANFMSIQSPLDLCCEKIVSMCKDKTENKIYKELKCQYP